MQTKPFNEHQDKDTAAFLEVLLDRARRGNERWESNYAQARADLEFLYAESQWPEHIRQERENEGRVCLTINNLGQYLDQVVGDQRQNRPAIHVHAVEDSGQRFNNLAGTKDYKQAEVFEGLIRNIEYISDAESQYDMAFQQACEAGIGWLRVVSEYSNDSAFDQDLNIEAIQDRFSVLIDPDAKKLDYSDADWCLISQFMGRKEFEHRYPNAQPSDLADNDRDYSFWYDDQDRVRVCEYFWREPVKRKLLMLNDGRVVFEDAVKAVLDELAADGIQPLRSREVWAYKVYRALVTGTDILEKKKEWIGSQIPVIPVFGKEHHDGNQRNFRGMFRYAKEPSQMRNFWHSAATERIALSPKAPYVAEAQAIEGYEEEWETANTENHSVLRYKEGKQKPQREMPASMPVAELNLLAQTTDDVKATIGIYDASLGQQSNETSGKAILARQRQGDRGTYAFIDNLSKSIASVGRILIDCIPRVYDGDRIIRVLGESGAEDSIVINQTVLDQQTQTSVLIHDLSQGKFDVTVKAGPSYQTQRMEAADSMLQFMQTMPEQAQLVVDLFAESMDWPNAKEVAKRIKMQMPAQFLSPEEQQEFGMDQPQEPPEPTPAEQAEMAKSQAVIAKAEADTVMAEAKGIEAEAKIAELQTPPAKPEQSPEPNQLEATVRQLVADAVAELINSNQPPAETSQ